MLSLSANIWKREKLSCKIDEDITKQGESEVSKLFCKVALHRTSDVRVKSYISTDFVVVFRFQFGKPSLEKQIIGNYCIAH